jgi:Effector-associated domain 1
VNEERLTDPEIRELAQIFDDRNRAGGLLRAAGFPADRIPEMQGGNSIEFWREVNRMVGGGVMKDGRRNILAAAGDVYPFNPVFTGEVPRRVEFDGRPAGDRGTHAEPPVREHEPRRPVEQRSIPSETGRSAEPPPPRDVATRDGGHPAGRWVPMAATLALLALVGTIVGVLISTSGGAGPSPTAGPPVSGPAPSLVPDANRTTTLTAGPAPTPAANPGAVACPAPALPGGTAHTAIVVEPGTVPGLTVASVSYLLSVAGGDAYITLALDLQGTIPAGQRLIMVARGSPTTRDGAGSPGADVDFYKDQYPLPATGCQRFGPMRLGYPGAAGLTYRHRIMLADQAVLSYIATRRTQSSYKTYGINKDELQRRGARLVAGFDVVTGG